MTEEQQEQIVYPPAAIIGTPHNNNLTFPFVQSLFQLLIHEINSGQNRRYGGWIPSGSCYVHRNRNLICHKFLQSTATYLWFVDTDLEFGPDYLQQLCNKAEDLDTDILACPYLLFGGEISFYSETSPGHYVSYDDLKPDETYDLDSAGTGNMLIHRRVLESMLDRYFGVHRKLGEEFPASWFAYDRVDNVVLGEDMTFCRRAKKEGFKVTGWAGCPTNHLKLQPVMLPPRPEPHPADEPEEEGRIIVP